jgi:hypothetical protein
VFGNRALFGDDAQFGNRALFGDDAQFGTNAVFGTNAQFGNNAQFGTNAQFGNWAQFGTDAQFGDDAVFGNGAQFGNWARFGTNAVFGNDAVFGNRALFGDDAVFELLTFKAKPGNPLIQFDRFGSACRNTQFFNTDGGIWVRCGCQLLILEDFRKRVREQYADQGHGLTYLGIANLAEEYFRQEDERNAE